MRKPTGSCTTNIGRRTNWAEVPAAGSAAAHGGLSPSAVQASGVLHSTAMRSTYFSRAASLLLSLSGMLCAQNSAGTLPPMKKQPNAAAVVNEHLDAIK